MSPTAPADDASPEAVDESTTAAGEAGATLLTPTLDLLASALVAVFGVAVAASGVALAAVADVAAARSLYADLPVQSTLLSDQVAVRTLHNFGVWGGAGMAAVGILSVAAAAGYYRRRSRAREAGRPAPDAATCAFLGGVVAVVASSVPFAPVLGGAAAGYLGRSGPRYGVYAGLVAAVPVLVVLGALAGGALAAGATPVAALLVAVAAGALLYYAALGALGGYAEARLNAA